MSAPQRFVPGQILVRPKSGLSESDFGLRLMAHGAEYRQLLRHINVRVINVPIDRTDAVLAALQTDPGIEFAERDGIGYAAFVPNDTYVISGSEWHLAKIQAPQAWDMTTGAGAAIIGILDSGINAAHPDLAGRVLPGYNFVSNNNNPADDFGHGTAVAGTVVAAGNNGLGVAGVAYGCVVLPVKVVDASGFASYSCLAQGIKYAVDHGARVLNISIAGDTASSTLQNAIDYAWSNNVVVVAAAGNNANNILHYPAACDHVVAVSATEPDDSLAAFSSYGTFVTLAAPGDNIWTTQSDLSNPYGSWRGTSFASPIVASVAALIASANPSLSNTQIVSLLATTADDAGAAGYDPSFGFGRVNALRAVSAASIAPGAQPLPPPDTNVITIPGGKATLIIQTSGGGRVTPNLNSKQLQVGTVYNLKAVPGPGQVFAGWGGAATMSSQSPNLNFVMQPNLKLVANFVPSPFAPMKGNYAGLAADTNGVTTSNSGYFALSLRAAGTFSGRLLLGGARFGFRGQFNAAGQTVVTVRRPGLVPLTVTLNTDPAQATDQVSGTVSDGNWTAAVSGDRNTFSAGQNPAAQAGLRAFILQAAGSNVTTVATGASRISPGGSTRVHGRLADGRPFSAGSTLSKSGYYPFYVSLQRATEIVIGWLNFPSGTVPDAGGTVLWVNNGTNAFARTLQAAAAP
jgi:hypothetical protein